MKIRVANDRMVFPSSIKIANKYESDTRTIDFDLSKVEFHGNAYLVLKYRDSSEYFTPLLIGEQMSIPVKTFMSAKDGIYDAIIAISSTEINEDYDFSQDNPMFISNVFQVTVEDNFLSGTEQDWALTPAAQNYFDQLIALVDKVQSDLDSGAFVGNGIQSITKISTSGLVDTYQIAFTNGSTFDYQVTNGQDGQTPTITIQDGYWYINGVNTGQQAQGEQGEPGKDGTDGTDGVGIQSIEKTFTEGNVDTYTITYTNETTSTFTVTNGINGFTPNITIGTVATLQPTEQATATITGTPENPVLNLGIPQGVQGEPGQGGNDNKLIGTVSKSENPSVSDSYNTELMNLIFYGKSTQVTTNGYQLIPYPPVEKTKTENGVTATYNDEDESITLTGISTAGFNYIIIDNLILDPGDYTFSVYGALVTGLILFFRDMTNSDTLVQIKDGNTYGYVTIDTQITTRIYFNIEYAGTAIRNKTYKVMLEKGKTPHAFEPYTGGQPSPSPEYKQDVTAIEQISGSVIGKNLINPETCMEKIDSWQESGITFTKNDDGSFHVKGTATNNVYISFIGIELYEGKTYKISINNPKFNLIIFGGKSFVSNLITNTVNSRMATKTALNDLSVQVNSGTRCDDDIYFMLEIGSDNVNTSMTSYEPYTEKPFSFTPPQPLYSSPDGSIADVVNVGSGEYEYNMSGAVVLDGSPDEVWGNYSVKNGFVLAQSGMTKGLYLKGWCNKFITQSSSSATTGVIFGSGTQDIYFVNVNDIATTVDEWKQWLSENPITVVYQLATPTTQPIPQETLDILRKLRSNKGVTNVISNVPISFDYEQDVNIVIQNIWNAINNNTLSIETKG